MKQSSDPEIKELQNIISIMSQQLRMVLSSIDEDNLSPDLLDKLEKGDN
jgi:hypothetical protein